MPQATTENNGTLVAIDQCYLDIPNAGRITFNNLPDISDSKSVSYNDEPIIGRSTPLKTFKSSETRTISMQIHLFVTSRSDVSGNIQTLRAIESAAYTRSGQGGAPFIPPPVCKIKCGALLGDTDVCVVLKSYSVKFPTDVAWSTYDNQFTPFKFDIDTTWDVVYSSEKLPGQDSILTLGV